MPGSDRSGPVNPAEQRAHLLRSQESALPTGAILERDAAEIEPCDQAGRDRGRTEVKQPLPLQCEQWLRQRPPFPGELAQGG